MELKTRDGYEKIYVIELLLKKTTFKKGSN